MPRAALLVIPWLMACTADDKSAGSLVGDTADGEDGVWPRVDTAQDCPGVDFAADGAYTRTADVVYDTEAGEALLLDVYLPELAGPRPGVVMVHGGGFTSGSRSYMERAAE